MYPALFFFKPYFFFFIYFLFHFLFLLRLLLLSLSSFLSSFLRIAFQCFTDLPQLFTLPHSFCNSSLPPLGHIRCTNPESASRILQLGLLNFDISLLAGKEEDDYWEKLRLDRESRKKSGNKKKKVNRANNGFKKIVDRALKSPGDEGSGAASAAPAPRTHMRFDDDCG